MLIVFSLSLFFMLGYALGYFKGLSLAKNVLKNRIDSLSLTKTSIVDVNPDNLISFRRK